MINKTSLATLTMGFALAISSTASAQGSDPTKAFVDVNVGAQTQSRSFTSASSFPLYQETAVVNSAQSIDSGGFFDVSGGYRVMKRFPLSVGIGFSIFSNDGDGAVVASIPNPNVFNNPAVSTTNGSDLKHSEVGTHVLVVWSVPIDDKLDATISAGPSFFQVKQDVLSATVVPGTQTLNVATHSEKKTGTGGNFAINLNYMLKPNYGVGIFLRYAGATVDLPSVENLKVGGFQFGLGGRLRF
jgi:hypothetical protein